MKSKEKSNNKIIDEDSQWSRMWVNWGFRSTCRAIKKSEIFTFFLQKRDSLRFTKCFTAPLHPHFSPADHSVSHSDSTLLLSLHRHSCSAPGPTASVAPGQRGVFGGTAFCAALYESSAVRHGSRRRTLFARAEAGRGQNSQKKTFCFNRVFLHLHG